MSGKAKIFSWLLHQNYLWCNDRVQRRGWVNGYLCHLCIRNLESSFHLFWGCSVSVAIWNQAPAGMGVVHSCRKKMANEKTTTEATSAIINCSAPRHARRSIKSMIIFIASEIRQERNNCVFLGKQPSNRDVIKAIRSTLELWRLAGGKKIGEPLRDPL